MLITRVNAIEAGAAIGAKKIEDIDAKVTTLNDDVRGALNTVVDGDAAKDQTFRGELSSMAKNLDSAVESL